MFSEKKNRKKGQNCWVGTKDTVLCRSAAQLEEMGMSNNTQARKKKKTIETWVIISLTWELHVS